ncbi:hypothetical protein T492DRAFT_834197 [Pavlovales sp. CCMP2436]|nr:hypothetical protein T492DRAFT_834197 [Pavlovales sp. CCMP2436]
MAPSSAPSSGCSGLQRCSGMKRCLGLQRFAVTLIVAALVVGAAAAGGATEPVLRYTDHCVPCGGAPGTGCLSQMCQEGRCVASQVVAHMVGSGWAPVSLPAVCKNGTYACARDTKAKSLICSKMSDHGLPDGCTPAMMSAEPVSCAAPWPGDVRLQATERTTLLQQFTGQLMTAPPTGILMVYGMDAEPAWRLTCADAEQAEVLAAADVVRVQNFAPALDAPGFPDSPSPLSPSPHQACLQLGAGPASSVETIDLIPLMTELAQASAGPSDKKASAMSGIDEFGSLMTTLYGPAYAHVSGKGYPLRSCSGSAASPSSLLQCLGEPLARHCSRTQVTAGGLYCAHYPVVSGPRRPEAVLTSGAAQHPGSARALGAGAGSAHPHGKSHGAHLGVASAPGSLRRGRGAGTSGAGWARRGDGVGGAGILGAGRAHGGDGGGGERHGGRHAGHAGDDGLEAVAHAVI